jgi:hypothetical protein
MRKRKHITLKDLHKLAYEHIWSSDTELRELLNLVCIYNNTDKAVRIFMSKKNVWTE